MTQWRLFGNPFAIVEDGDSFFSGILGKSDGTTEIFDCKFYTNFTCTDLRLEFITVSVSAVVTLRDDGVDTDVAVSVTMTGWTEDLTDSATVAANSLMSLNGVNGGTMHGDNLTMLESLLTIEHASTDAPIMGGGINISRSATEYSTMGTGPKISTTQTDVAITFQRATSLSNLRNVANIADTSPDWDISPFKNGTASTSVTINLTATGAVEDITGSESYAVDDTASFGFVRTAGNASFDIFQIDADTPEMWVNSGGSIGVGATRVYMSLSNSIPSTTADDDYDMRIGSVSAGHLETFIVGAGTGTRDVLIRVGSTNSTNLTINVTTSGYLEDLTGSESVADSDSMLTSGISSGDTMNVSYIAVECPWSDPSAGGAARRVMITSD